MSSSVLISLKNIRKTFRATVALDGASLEVEEGEVQVLLGENGAGKSTLMKIVAGALQPDSGTLLWKDRPVRFQTPLEARGAGVAMVHQELNLIFQLSVAENVFLGNLPGRPLGRLDRAALEKNSRRLLEEVGLDCSPETRVSRLGVAEQQMVEIARALALEARLIIMDEPTSSLSAPEVERLFGIIRRLTAGGVAVIYITHRLEELGAVGDRLTVLRDGKTVGSGCVKDVSRDEILRLMVGREPRETFVRRWRGPGKERLRVEQVFAPPRVRDVSFAVRAGEILGVAGLVGSGRTDLLRGLFGAGPREAGRILIDGREVSIASPRAAVACGMGFLTENRKEAGLILGASVWANLVLAAGDKHSRWGFFDSEREEGELKEIVRALAVKLSSLLDPAFELSGGNQQKVVLGRWLYAEAGILLFDEPTRGIDMGARDQVYRLMEDLAGRGAAIVMVSSDMLEILAMSDRIMVMREGRVTGFLDGAEATEEAVLRLQLGETA